MGTQLSHKRYVAYFDMLGFKAAVLRNQDEAWGALSDIKVAVDEVLRTKIQIMSSNELIQDRVKIYMFSDSVILFSKSNDYADLIAILILSSQLFGICLKSCIPLRGGIAYGDFYFNKDLFCGIPLVTAYQIGECAQWTGVVVDDVVAQHFEINKKNNKESVASNILIEWDVPLKGNKSQRRFVINWPAIFKKNWNSKPPLAVEEYYLAFESLFGDFSQLNSNDQIKYKNTVNFINESLLTSEF